MGGEKLKGNWTVRDDVRVNLLCLVGAFMGAFSVTLEWLTQTFDTRYGPTTTHFDLMGLLGSGMADQSLVFAAGLFVAGTLIAFITPYAGFMQVGGLLIFFGKVVPGILAEKNVGVGAIFGIASTILVLYSLFNPVGLGIPKSHSGPSGNYLTVACRDKSFHANALCIIGAGLAVIAVFLPWASTTIVSASDGLTSVYPATPVDDVSGQTGYEGVGTQAFAVTITVLFAGVVFSFLTPVGGFVQLLAVALFYGNISDLLTIGSQQPEFTFFRTELAYGFFVGIVAVGITILSFFFTLEGRPVKDLFKVERILTWTLRAKQEDDSSSGLDSVGKQQPKDRGD